MITLFRFLVVSLSSLVKRLFSSDPILYFAISLLPILSISSRILSSRGLLVSLLVVLLSFFSGLINYPYAFLPLCLLLAASPVFLRLSFFGVASRLQIILLFSSLYAVYQYLFGYTDFEIAWIRSGLGFAEERSFLEIGVTRPFSFFASMADFSLFLNIFLFYYLSLRKYILAVLVFAIMCLAGSRGMIVGSLFASSIVLLKVRPSKFLFLSLPILCSIPFTLAIILSPYLYSLESIPFYLNPGSLFGRTSQTFVPSVSFIADNLPMSLLSPLPFDIPFDSYTIDNMYLFAALYFGIPFSFLLLYLLTRLEKSTKNLYFLALFLSYGFFSDIVTNFSFTFFLFFCLLSKDKSYVSVK